MTDAPVTDLDLQHLTKTIEAAARLARAGSLPFAARLVDGGGKTAIDSENEVQRTGDPTAHAEVQLVRTAVRLGVALAGSTVYTAVEPCAMCSAALIFAGVGRVVYAASAERLGPYLRLPPGIVVPGVTGRALFDATPDGPVMIGPVMEEEAIARLFAGDGPEPGKN